MYEHRCYNKLRVVGKALEVSHKSGGKRQRAAGARLYIINKDVEEVQGSVLLWILLRRSPSQQS